MSPSGRSAARRTGQVVTGLGALVVLIGLLVGGPVALVAFAGNPLPDQLPSLGEVGSALTSRDDGQLFIRALALLGWLGWATFALSVLVELPARAMRRPAPRLPGMRRQQKAVAALVGSVALILAASPAAAATATMMAPPAPAAGHAASHLAPARGVAHAGWGSSAPPPQAWSPGAQTGSYGYPTSAAQHAGTARHAGTAGPAIAAGPGGAAGPAGRAGQDGAGRAAGPAGRAGGPPPTAGPPMAAGPAPHWLASGGTADQPAPVYRVAVGDYLGQIADRYLGDFARYRELARLNRIPDPSLIRPGQLLRLPPDAIDHGRRPHATGRLIRPPARPHRTVPPAAALPAPVPPPAVHPSAQPSQPGQPHRGSDAPLAAGAARAGEAGALNRPLAVSGVLAVAGMVGAQIGALLGLRRRPPSNRGSASESGRHRRLP